MSDPIDEEDAVAQPASPLQGLHHVDGYSRVIDLVGVHLWENA